MKQLLKDLEGDKLHVLMLFLLYVLQGIPVGLYKAIPLILTNHGVPYTDQALFSIAYYPYSMKLLWAPLVDSLYFKRFGRRKSWLVPTQTLIGITMVVLSLFISGFLGEAANPAEVQEIDIKSLTAVFLLLTILSSTQDIATDGWCISMLKPSNVGYASTCQSVGLTAGFSVGYILFTALESKGIITIAQFLMFWGVVFLIATAAIGVFKKEVGESVEPEEVSLGLIDTYKALWKMIRHPMLFKMIVFLTTYGLGVSAAESMSNLKLIEKGVPKDEIALLEIPMIFVKIFVTLFVTRFTVGQRPMNVWMVTFPLRLFFCLALTVLVFVAPLVMLEDGGFPTEFYGAIIVVFALDRAMSLAMWVAVIAFFARISDPRMGATYMSFFTTLNSLGTRWPISLNLWLVDKITYKNCVEDFQILNSTLYVVTDTNELNLNKCYEKDDVETCKANGGVCETSIDGFYILSVGCVVIGYLWFIWAGQAMRKWQKVEAEDWRVSLKTSSDPEEMANVNVDEMEKLK